MDKRQESIVMTAKVFSLAVSGLVLVFGILMATIPEEMGKALCLSLGILCLLIATAKIFGYFSNDLYRIAFQFDFAGGCVVALFGLLLLIAPAAMIPRLGAAVAIYVLVDGLVRVQTAIDAQRFGMPYWYLLLIGAVLLVGGAAVIFFLALPYHRVLFTGILMIADAFLSVIVTMYTVRVRVRKTRRDADFDLPPEL